MKYIFAIILTTSFFSAFAQIGVSEKGIELEKFIEQKDTLSIVKYHRQFDEDFSSQWKLNKAETRVEIGHFICGYNFNWVQRKSDTVVYRTYTFDIHGNFSYGHEQRLLNEKLISQGLIELEGGSLKYIRQVYPKEITPEFVVDYNEFELFDNGKLVAIYRTGHLNHFYMLAEKKNSDKIELVYGIDRLNVKK